MGGDGAEGFTLRTSIAAIVGRTASRLGGGKFANGAVTGAFVHMFNAEMGKQLKTKEMNMRTLTKISDEIDRISNMSQETFEKEITWGVKYETHAQFLEARMSVLQDLAVLAERNTLIIGINNNYMPYIKSIGSAINFGYNLFGLSENYQVGYFCIPGSCHAVGVYHEKK